MSIIKFIGNTGIPTDQVGVGISAVVGPTGAQGWQGWQGFQGWQGISGFSTNTGAQGLQGFQGLQGVQGTQGLQGFQGFQGNSYWTQSSSNIYYNAGNVGIGTINPTYKLEIDGNLAFQNQGTILAKNSTGTYETFCHPRWSNDATYINYGQGGLYLRNYNGTSSNMFLSNLGNVGINSTSPAYRLTVNQAGYGIVHTDGTTVLGTSVYSGRAWFGTQNNYPLSLFVNNGAPALTVDTNSNVGIGTTSPGVKLDIIGKGRFGQNSSISIDGDSLNSQITNTIGNMLFYNPISYGYIWHINNSEKMRIDLNGNIGIGTSNPTQKLHIQHGGINLQGDNAKIYIGDGSSNYGNQGLEINTRWSGAEYPPFRVQTANNNAFIIMPNGTIGIGTSDPNAAKVHIQNGTSYDQLAVDTGSGSNGRRSNISLYSTFENIGDTASRRTSDIVSGFNGGAWGTEYMSFNVGSSNDAKAVTSEKMRITSVGNVGINTINPVTKLDVNGDVNFIGNIQVPNFQNIFKSTTFNEDLWNILNNNFNYSISTGTVSLNYSLASLSLNIGYLENALSGLSTMLTYAFGSYDENGNILDSPEWLKHWIANYLPTTTSSLSNYTTAQFLSLNPPISFYLKYNIMPYFGKWCYDNFTNPSSIFYPAYTLNHVGWWIKDGKYYVYYTNNYYNDASGYTIYYQINTDRPQWIEKAASYYITEFIKTAQNPDIAYQYNSVTGPYKFNITDYVYFQLEVAGYPLNIYYLKTYPSTRDDKTVYYDSYYTYTIGYTYQVANIPFPYSPPYTSLNYQPYFPYPSDPSKPLSYWYSKYYQSPSGDLGYHNLSISPKITSWGFAGNPFSFTFRNVNTWYHTYNPTGSIYIWDYPQYDFKDFYTGAYVGGTYVNSPPANTYGLKNLFDDINFRNLSLLKTFNTGTFHFQDENSWITYNGDQNEIELTKFENFSKNINLHCDLQQNKDILSQEPKIISNITITNTQVNPPISILDEEKQKVLYGNVQSFGAVASNKVTLTSTLKTSATTSTVNSTKVTTINKLNTTPSGQVNVVNINNSTQFAQVLSFVTSADNSKRVTP